MKKIVAALALFCLAFNIGYSQNKDITKVYTVFKTHLDVGFTDLSSVVEKRYLNEFISKAIAVSERLKDEGSKDRYVWTTGSWLIWEYLNKASNDDVARLEAAIKRGDIVWNGAAYTYESELMNKELFETTLYLSNKLDQMYGKSTIAAKMTDVPGQTRAIIPILNKVGLKYLHVGVNPATPIPDVPDYALWRDTDGSEIILMYQKDYGTEAVLPDGKSVVSVNFTGDNHGPHSYEQIKGIYSYLREKYPNAEIIGGSFNDIAQELLSMKETLPVVTSEIGDTWIYGCASSPVRMARFRELSRIYSEWVNDKKIDPRSDVAINFAVRLGLIAEHTQGCDIKTHLRNWDKYDVDKFNDARSSDPFKKVEASWKELDNYVDEALAFLPSSLKKEAIERLSVIDNIKTPLLDGAVRMDKPAQFALSSKSINLLIGSLTYRMYDHKDYEKYLNDYLRSRPGWAYDDIGKTGLDKSEAVSAVLSANITQCKITKEKKGTRTVCELNFVNDKGIDSRVLPQKIFLDYFEYKKGKKADIALTIEGKPAVRLPESYWFSFVPENIIGVVGEKIGRKVDFMDVVAKGSRQMNAIDSYVDVITTGGTVRIWSDDAFLVNVGEARGINYSTEKPDMKGGVHFNLSNNLWGTNYSMWNEGSLTYRFRVEMLDGVE